MDKLSLFKKLLPGLLPILIFIIADEIWGTKIGLIVAIVFGIAELIYILITEKKLDKFVLFDTALIVFLGAISIYLDNDIFFKLKPAFIGLIFVTILGISSFSKLNIMTLMSKRYMKDVEFKEQQIRQMNKTVKLFFYIFTAHTALVFYSAFYMSTEAWAFISGVLFYIIFGIIFLIQLVQNKIHRK